MKLNKQLIEKVAKGDVAIDNTGNPNLELLRAVLKEAFPQDSTITSGNSKFYRKMKGFKQWFKTEKTNLPKIPLLDFLEKEEETFPLDDFGVLVENENGKEIIDYLVSKGFKNSVHYNGCAKNTDYYCVLKNSKLINNHCTGSFPYRNPTSKTYTLQQLKQLDMGNKIDYTIIGTKLPDIPIGTEFRCLSWNPIQLNGNTMYNNNHLFSFGSTVYNGELYILAEYEQYRFQNHYMFKLSDLQKLTNNNMENKEIIGYKAPYNINAIITKNTLYVKNGGSYCPERKKGHGSEWYLPLQIVETWEPVYKETKKLPKINGYEGKVEGDFVIYGNNCAKFHKQFFKDLQKLIIHNHNSAQNRVIKSITLDSGVEITMEQVNQIVDFLN